MQKKDLKKIVIACFWTLLIIAAFLYRDFLFGLMDLLKENAAENVLLVALALISAKIFGAVTLLPGAPLTLLTGSIFTGGAVQFLTAVTIAWAGNTLGAVGAFFIGRYLFRDYLNEKVLPKYPRLGEFDKKIARKGMLTVIAIRLIPVFPFNIINYLLGVTCVRAKDYIIGTAIGLIPGTAAFVLLGKGLGALSPVTLGMGVVGLVVLSYIGKKLDQ